MKEMEMQDRIVFRNERPEEPVPNMKPLYGIMQKIGLKDNLFTTIEEFTTFQAVLGDFGINSITHFQDLDDLRLKGCEHEIRISPYVLFIYFGFPEEQLNQIRYELYADAWYGIGGIFNEQIDPDNSIGINLTDRLPESESDFEGFVDFFRTTCEQLPEKGEIIQLRNYVDEIDLYIGKKISDFQIRLLYKDAHRQLRDLVSAFRHINRRLCEPFELIIETE